LFLPLLPERNARGRGVNGGEAVWTIQFADIGVDYREQIGPVEGLCPLEAKAAAE
jgi:hypothetical protein